MGIPFRNHGKTYPAVLAVRGVFEWAFWWILSSCMEISCHRRFTEYFGAFALLPEQPRRCGGPGLSFRHSSCAYQSGKRCR
ncbi:unnamed protein product [Cladocopium goreaui]|nr:unnamed protein product [Cladocopium goreaui]